MKIREGKGVVKYLQRRNILKQYKIAKKHFEKNHFKIIDDKLRKPKINGIYQFKITGKYRAFYVLREEGAVVYKISDHQ